MISDLPFILASGYCIDAALRLSGLLRKDVFLSNVVHCHPAGNRGSLDEERKKCLPFLVEELRIVKPKLVVALGNDAKQALDDMETMFLIDYNIKFLKVKHPASFMYGSPEQRIDWIVKLSLEIDRVYK